jgi:hypothetical protein
MKNLKITVSGAVTTGNSYLVYEIRRLLRANGWNVEHDYNSEDNETEIDLDKCLVDNLDIKINNVKANTIVIINEKQLARAEM